MTDYHEARDVDGKLYIPAVGLARALDKAREQGREIERAKWMSLLTPRERMIARIREACEEAGIRCEDVMCDSHIRDRKVCRVRYDLFLEFNEGGMSAHRLGKLFNRDHKTVLYGIKVARERRDEAKNSSSNSGARDTK